MSDWLGAPQLWVGLAIGVLLSGLGFAVARAALGRRYKITSASLNLPFNLGNVTYEPSQKEREIAWHLYVQLRTRKAALSFDSEHDVICEVYDSLYELFPITRELLMNLPLDEIEKPDNVADLMLRVQNDGLRPHLTKWQADFRRWWTHELSKAENDGRRPQDLQKAFPQFDALTEDLKRMNDELNQFAEDLLVIARARPSKGPGERPEPTPPAEGEQPESESDDAAAGAPPAREVRETPAA